jgi:hypothetical protein
MEEKEIMNTAEVAKLTGYKPVTIRKYALILDVPFCGNGRGKIYMWSEADITRFREEVVNNPRRRSRGEK